MKYPSLLPFDRQAPLPNASKEMFVMDDLLAKAMSQHH